MKLTFSCPPHLAAIVPEPLPAKHMIPSWFKTMRHQTKIGAREKPTVKQCPPFLDALSSGFYFRLAADINFDGHRFSWDRSDKTMVSTPFLNGPMSFHQQDELAGSPLLQDKATVVKFHNYWCVRAEPGWSLLFLHPMHQFDLPFRTISGLVDVDKYANVPVQLPATWHTDKPCLLKRGTVIAQCIPIKRDSLLLEITTMSSLDYNISNRNILEVLAIPHTYRRKFRSR
jgi:hypothetical protein